MQLLVQSKVEIAPGGAAEERRWIELPRLRITDVCSHPQPMPTPGRVLLDWLGRTRNRKRRPEARFDAWQKHGEEPGRWRYTWLDEVETEWIGAEHRIVRDVRVRVDPGIDSHWITFDVSAGLRV